MAAFFNQLYVRIWLAVVLAVAVLTLLVGWAWRMASDPPLREVVVRNAAGEVIGHGNAHLGRQPGPPRLHLNDRPAGPRSATSAPPNGRFGEGPEFEVRMQDGQSMHLHMPHPPRSNWRAPFGFFWTLGLVAIAVALATYPIVRRLTRRLESLQAGVERWGEGDLSARVALDGKDEVGYLAERFNHAAQRIETLVKSHEDLLASQKSLLANASHELRSPLTRIRMGLEMLGGASNPAAREEIARNIGELDQLIEEILLASRLDAREADLGTIESIDLVGLCAEECARAQASLDVHGALLEAPGVAKLLRRAIRNLLENARKHARNAVALSLQQQDGFALIQVSDDGPGIPVAHQDRIFEPFYRLPGASERDGGVGLGLALVRSITLRHGGTVQCKNRPEGGACFEIRLPLH